MMKTVTRNLRKKKRDFLPLGASKPDAPVGHLEENINLRWPGGV
jgi:hypothetical protein